MSVPFEVRVGNCVDLARELPDGSVNLTVSSLPYWGARKYHGDQEVDWPACSYVPLIGCPCAIEVPAMRAPFGMEPTPQAFIAHAVLLCEELRRATAEDGTLWLNHGDNYATSRNGAKGEDASRRDVVGRCFIDKPFSTTKGGYKAKQLIAQAHQLALALQAAGWWWRSHVVWDKPNPMHDAGSNQRPGVAHEHLFMFTKGPTYYYDNDAVRVITGRESTVEEYAKAKGDWTEQGNSRMKDGHAKRGPGLTHPLGRALRSVWRVPAGGAGTNAKGQDVEKHTATFPPRLIVPCIKASSRVGDLVLDPCSGMAGTGMAAVANERRYLGFEKHVGYAETSLAKLHLAVGTEEGRRLMVQELQAAQVEGQGFLFGKESEG